MLYRNVAFPSLQKLTVNSEEQDSTGQVTGDIKNDGIISAQRITTSSGKMPPKKQHLELDQEGETPDTGN